VKAQDFNMILFAESSEIGSQQPQREGFRRLLVWSPTGPLSIEPIGSCPRATSENKLSPTFFLYGNFKAEDTAFRLSTCTKL